MKHANTKGEVETAIRNTIIKFEQEFMGRGPMDVKTSILRDLVVVRRMGVLTPAERQLGPTGQKRRGGQNGQAHASKFDSAGRGQASPSQGHYRRGVTGLFTDIDTRIGERMFIFTLEEDLETKFH